MNKKFYQLANRITPEYSTYSEDTSDRLAAAEIKKYQEAVSARILAMEKEDAPQSHTNRRKPKFFSRQISKYTAAAACTAILLLGAAVFGKDAHAAIKHISWSIGSALGLPGDLADYRDIINTPAMDNGYMITLQEAVATDEKLVINYTIQREDGLSMAEALRPSDSLYINGKRASGGSSGSIGFIDDEQTIIGVDMSYDVPGLDMTQKNSYQLKIDALEGFERTAVKGNWDFAFTADGSELITDTKRIPIGQEFTISDGITITLDELTLNALEQRITYHANNGVSDYILQITATDTNGKQAEFNTKFFGGLSGEGYMQNAEILYDGRIDEYADTVTLTLYAEKLPETSGPMSHDLQQIGEPFTLNLH